MHHGLLDAVGDHPEPGDDGEPDAQRRDRERGPPGAAAEGGQRQPERRPRGGGPLPQPRAAKDLGDRTGGKSRAEGHEEGRDEAPRSGARPALEHDRRRAGNEAGRQCDVNEAGGPGRLLDAATADHRRGRGARGAPGGQRCGKKCGAEPKGRRNGQRAPAHDKTRRRHGEFRSQRGRRRKDGQHEAGEANSRGESHGHARRPHEQALDEELEPDIHRPEPHRSHHAHLPDARLEHRREAVEYDEERRQEDEKAHPLQHHLHRPHDAMEIDLPLRGSSHLEAFRKNGREGIPDDPEFPVSCNDDIHAVDEPRAGECLLGGEEVHHDEVPAVDAADALRLDQPSHGELSPAGRCLELESRAHLKPPRRGEGARQQDRIRLAEKHQRIIDLNAALVADVVHADGRIIGDVDTMDSHELAASVGRERRRAHDRNGELDTRYSSGSGRDILREERALAGRDLERSATGHGVDDLYECRQHGAIHDIDGAHQRDAPGERDESENKAASVATEQTERETKAGEPHSKCPH